MTSDPARRRRGGRHAVPASAEDAQPAEGAVDAMASDAAAPDATAPDVPAEVAAAAAPAAAAFGRLVAVMDRLRSPGGCPWDAEQTHASLVPYALEEVHELAEAVDAGDRVGLREELGDVLLQVVFHARVAQEDPADPFDVAEVADRLVAKLVRRHPHVFGDEAGSPAPGDVHRRWDEAKRAEKPARVSALDGVPASLGALARTQKVAGKAARAGLLTSAAPDAPAGGTPHEGAAASAPQAAAAVPARADVPAGAPADTVPLSTDAVHPDDRNDVDAAVAVVTAPVVEAATAPDADAPAVGRPVPGTPHADAPATGTPATGTPAADAPAADAPAAGTPVAATPSPDAAVESALGARLLALVLEAERDGVDAEGALRRAAAAWEVGLRAAERGDAAAGAPRPWR
ncbi:MazG nucleotide pyrophosphohydrolase domain-containing protein [Cellulomonas shaoxiangyii]|uniref:MazG nucleotide pyrophosphohydrolase domain-containing protein n=1 Tax=Cellulomonas shaoxiangyii TaxID=2566013 RepID=UPI001FB60AF7|nr:MazG nucleotide pyrophosphohydrolase domain-containing protein [Cellulomonas shaoxiangyii]